MNKSVPSPSVHKKQQQGEKFNIPAKRFVTRVTSAHCRKRGHVLQDIEGIIDIATPKGDIVEQTFTGAYCEQCKGNADLISHFPD